MAFKLGDIVVIRANSEELQSKLFQEIDGAKGEITEIYQIEYEPDIDRYEVTLEHAIEVNGETMRAIPGLYKDNLELVEKGKRKNNSSSENRAADSFKVFEAVSSKYEPGWYYGMADCRGLESLQKEPIESESWEDIDYLFDLGVIPDKANDTPEKKQFNKNINAMMMRAQANTQRLAVVFRAHFDSAQDAMSVNLLKNRGLEEDALLLLKQKADTIQIAKGTGVNVQSAWEKIPNPELDPMW